ncbi:NADPH-dependent oxidoreductase [Secundilactobacillus mixtipabuli]|uniref:NADPH-dependent FMN reductase n=1 Tax=Secundilactobacillus mixtipabuli TaxID=1435342 RepID=A0A1Z5IA30_9LACO|nr:NADPH-dependent oxidoreductase [Secundilactobacillus mixtipabuli]GAW98435.1 NADPH-dependent FMN reductase [Secundilactobacillus mixtipabuli]
MVKLVGIAGSIGEQSYNRMLLEFIRDHFKKTVDIEILDINDVPMFNEDEDHNDNPVVHELARKISGANGVILATPEHNHTVPAAMKNVIEWLSNNVHPLNGKAVWIVGASYHTQGSSRAQLHLKQILESPGVNAFVMPGNEFLLSNAKEAFNADGSLKDARTVGFLDSVMKKFLTFMKVIEMMDAPDPKNAHEEDMDSKHPVNTTVEGVDMNDPEWVEKAAEKTHAASGGDYVKLDRGLLTVDQLNYFLNSMAGELTFADDNNQFIYYNHNAEASQMLAARTPDQAGDPLSAVHPGRVIEHVKQVLYALRTGQSDVVSMPAQTGPNQHVMHYYRAMRDENRRYRGVNELVIDIMPILKYYLAATGQKLVKDPDAVPMSPITGLDAVTGASAHSTPSTDATSGASASTASAKPEPAKDPIDMDSLTGASEEAQPGYTAAENSAPAQKPESAPESDTDATTGASEH